MKMEEKLRILMQSENLTASRLAEILDVQPAAISHILSGRNKPSFEMVCKLVNRFPQINPYWLLGDAKEMRSNSATNNITNSTSYDRRFMVGNLFHSANNNTSTVARNPTSSVEQNPSTSVTTDRTNIDFADLSALGRYDISKIIIVYEDQTFEELRPKK